MNTGSCEYCTKPGPIRIHANETPEVSRDVFICDKCWRLLKNPQTALPLLRGHLTLTQRNQMSPKQLEARMNQFMEIISKWKPMN